MKVCEVVNETTNVCETWTEVVNPFIPTMTASEGQEIGSAILFAFVSVRLIILLQKAVEDRI